MSAEQKLVKKVGSNDFGELALPNERRMFLSTELAGPREIRLALAAVLISGVIFVAEGSPTRVKPLLAQEKKRTARLVGDVPMIWARCARGSAGNAVGNGVWDFSWDSGSA